MTFYDYSKTIIFEHLKKRLSLSEIISKIKDASKNGKIAFYPCGVYTREIINELKVNEPEVFNKIYGCFDKSSDASIGFDIKTFLLNDLSNCKNNISLLIVASNTYISKEQNDIRKFTDFDGKMLCLSNFDNSLSDISPSKIMDKIDAIYNFLEDDKSKITYILTWLSRLLNDETIASVFESEVDKYDFKKPEMYQNYTIKGIDEINMRELHAKLYQMKYVAPEKGNIVFDIGGYKGDTSIYFADQVGLSGKVYTFEPVKANFDILLKNIEFNNLTNIIVPINKACSINTGKAKMISGANGSPWAFLSNDKDASQIDMITIDEFVEKNNINNVDFIKVDVEGFESKVIEGAQETIKKFRPNMAICLYHKTRDLYEIPELMSNFNYKQYIRCNMEGPFAINLFCKY